MKWKKGVFTYISEKIREWDTIITSKRPQLSRCRGHFRDGTGGQSYDQDGRHGVGSSVAAGRVVEDLNEGVTGGTGQDVVNVTEREADGH
jgi:hypothetical protein